MPRGASSYNVEASKPEVSPVLLVRVLDIPAVGNPSSRVSLYLTDHGYTPETGPGMDVTFFNESGGVQVYTSCGLSFDAAEVSTDNQVDQAKIKLDNVDRRFSALAKDYELGGVEVHILRGFVETLGTPDGAMTVFQGHLEAVAIGESVIEGTVATDFNLKTRIPRRYYDVNRFPHLPSSKDPRQGFIQG